jgi:hypothetical protein
MDARKAVSILLTATVTAATAGFNAVRAAAATKTWTIKAGGAYTAKMTGSVVFSNIATGAKSSCALKSGGKVAATTLAESLSKTAGGTNSAQIGTVTAATLDSATNPCKSASGRGAKVLAAGTPAWHRNAFPVTRRSASPTASAPGRRYL